VKFAIADDDNGGGTFHSESDCHDSAIQGSILFTQGATQKTLYYQRPMKWGSFHLVTTSGSIANHIGLAMVHSPQPVISYAFTWMSTQGNHLSCNPIYIQPVDSAGAWTPTSLSLTTTITVAVTAGPGLFWQDPICTNPLTTCTLAPTTTSVGAELGNTVYIMGGDEYIQTDATISSTTPSVSTVGHFIFPF
jgi:hypothetical protein